MKTILVLVCLGLSLLGTALPAHAQTNLVANPGFETGSFSSWTLMPAASGSNFYVTTIYPHSGNYEATFSSSTQYDQFSQSIATTAGSLYDVSFWVGNDGNNSNGFQAIFGNTTLVNLVNSTIFGYQEYNFLGVPATGNSTTLSFAGYNLPGYYRMDDVSVTVSAAPEPSTWVLLGLGGAGLVGLAWRRRSRLA